MNQCLYIYTYDRKQGQQVIKKDMLLMLCKQHGDLL